MRYFDLNYMMGQGMLANGDYTSPSDILQQMDYLGIGRSLVWSAEARDWSAVNGNRQLLEELTPFKERLFPSFVFTPRDYYEKGTLDFYREQCASGRVKAFRICPKSGLSPLHECDFVLNELADLAPIVQIDARELEIRDFAELENLAQRFPSIHFVLGQKPWHDLDAAFNLMKRCDNVLMDTSWLHVRKTIELAVEHFGAERLLFATGHKSQHGAAIGALSHAEISDEDKEAIAHGNMERMLGLAPCTVEIKPPEILAQKPLWRAFASGETLHGLEIIDAHVHQGGPALNGYLLPDGDPSAALPEMIRTMDRIGVSHSIVMGSRALCGNCLAGNREFAKQAKPYRNRMHGYWVFNPRQCASMPEQILDEDFADGFFVGFKTLSGYWKVRHDDPRYKTLWEFANKRCLPVLIHTWNDVEPLRNVVPLYPNVKFIVAHCGGTDAGREEAVNLARDYENVYLETCGTFCTTRPLADAIDFLGPERFVFGSDAAYHNLAFELSAFLSIPLPDETLKMILCDNFRKICGDKLILAPR